MPYKPKIFLTQPGQEGLTALEETGYVAESVLQALLVDYPDLLPGDQINPENPRRWLLVSREMGVPDAADGGGRWSLDHLFLDQDGVATFVECKRADDTRARREVVAQMLDYAANGIEYWSMDRLRQAAAETAQVRGTSLDKQIEDLLDAADTDIEDYWDRVERNLQDHRVRLVFVADRTPKELRRLVEFLNEEMTNVEVLAVEVKQYKRRDEDEQKALVPRVIGITESTRAAKERSPSKPKLTRHEFLEQCQPSIRDFYTRAFARAEERGHILDPTTKGIAIRLRTPGGDESTLFYAYPEKLDFFLGGYLRQPQRLSEKLLERVLDPDVFARGTGEYTFHAYWAENDPLEVEPVFNLILDEVDAFIRRKEQQQ